MLTAYLEFNRDPVFLAGEHIQVKLTIENQSDESEESLAICTGQLTCRCAVNGTKVNREVVESQMSHFFNSSGNMAAYKSKFQIGSSKTSFNIAQDEKGYNVFCTKPEIVCCDLSLSAAESISFLFSVQLPQPSEMIPPTFNGHCVRFTYRLVFGFQQVGQPMQLLKCPIRVLVLCHKLHSEAVSQVQRKDSGAARSLTGSNDWKDGSLSSNPFIEESEVYHKSSEEFDQSVIQEAEIVIQSLCHRSASSGSPIAYSVRNGNTEIAKFCLAKSAFRIGEEITGFFDFNSFPQYCLQYVVSLQCEEKVADWFKLEPTAAAQPQSFCSRCEYVADITQTEVNLAVPHSVSPSFSTELVSLVWSLQFTFVIATESHPDIATKFTNTSFDEENDDLINNYKSASNFETFSWTLPITLLPNNPFKLQCCSSVLKRKHFLRIV